MGAPLQGLTRYVETMYLEEGSKLSVNEVRSRLEQWPGRPIDSAVPSKPTIRKIRDKILETGSDGWLNEKFSFDEKIMEKMMDDYKLPWESWQFMADLWRLTQSFLIRQQEGEKALQPTLLKGGIFKMDDEEISYKFNHPIVRLSHLIDEENYISIIITNRHALWAWRIASAIPAMKLLDILMFTDLFSKREARSGETPDFEDLWGYLVYQPWTTAEAAARYWNARASGKVPFLTLGSDLDGNNVDISVILDDEDLLKNFTFSGDLESLLKREGVRIILQYMPFGNVYQGTRPPKIGANLQHKDSSYLSQSQDDPSCTWGESLTCLWVRISDWMDTTDREGFEFPWGQSVPVMYRIPAAFENVPDYLPSQLLGSYLDKDESLNFSPVELDSLRKLANFSYGDSLFQAK